MSDLDSFLDGDNSGLDAESGAQTGDAEVIIEGETDGESDSEEEVIYVAKKPKSKPKKETITKPKKEAPIQRAQEVPRTIIKFL